jgi:hypothetical protein
MTFADLQRDDSVFVDANILVYHFTNHGRLGAPRTTLLERIELNELQGFTSSHCLSVVALRIVTIEAMGRLGWPLSRLAARLKKHHGEIRRVSHDLSAFNSPTVDHRSLLVFEKSQARASAIRRSTI